jgi:hypothetical protein
MASSLHPIGLKLREILSSLNADSTLEDNYG